MKVKNLPMRSLIRPTLAVSLQTSSLISLYSTFSFESSFVMMVPGFVDFLKLTKDQQDGWKSNALYGYDTVGGMEPGASDLYADLPGLLFQIFHMFPSLLYYY